MLRGRTDYEPGFPISTRSELTSSLFGLATDDIPVAFDCQDCA